MSTSASSARSSPLPTKRDESPLVSVRNLKTYYSIRGSFADRLIGREAGSVRAVNDVSFDLRQGEVLHRNYRRPHVTSR